MTTSDSGLDPQLIEDANNTLVEFGVKSRVLGEISSTIMILLGIVWLLGAFLQSNEYNSDVILIPLAFLLGSWVLVYLYYTYRVLKSLYRSIRSFEAVEFEDSSKYVYESDNWETLHSVRKDNAVALIRFGVSYALFLLWFDFWVDSNIDKITDYLSERIQYEVNKGLVGDLLGTLDMLTGVQLTGLVNTLGNQDALTLLLLAPAFLLGAVIVSNTRYLFEKMERSRYSEGITHWSYLFSELKGFLFISLYLAYECLLGELQDCLKYVGVSLVIMGIPTTAFAILCWSILPY